MKKKYIVLVFASASLLFLSFHQGSDFDLKASVERGKLVYTNNCVTCHQEQGEGVEGIFPPLAKSDYLMADKNRSIAQLLKGVSGEIKVNGKVYNGEMSAFNLTDKEASDVLNFIRNSFGNKGDAIKPEYVKVNRNKLKF